MTKKQLKEKTRALLYKENLSQEDKYFLFGLFMQHPHFKIKEGCGMKDVFVGKTIYGTKCFFIRRNDNSKVDISYLQCINGKPTKLSDIKAACRSAIRSIIKIKQSKVSYGIDKCEFTGEILLRQNTHIDHYDLSFDKVFKAWMLEKDVDELFNNLNDTHVDLECEIYFKNDKIKNDFIEFHNNNTHLRAISKKANLSKKK